MSRMARRTENSATLAIGKQARRHDLLPIVRGIGLFVVNPPVHASGPFLGSFFAVASEVVGTASGHKCPEFRCSDGMRDGSKLSANAMGRRRRHRNAG